MRTAGWAVGARTAGAPAKEREAEAMDSIVNKGDECVEGFSIAGCVGAPGYAFNLWETGDQ